MLNHFRTLLLNLQHDDNRENYDHIPVNFTTIVLPEELQRFYDLIFTDVDIFYMGDWCLRVIQGAGLEDDLKLFDSRISYTVKNCNVLHEINFDTIFRKLTDNYLVVERMLAQKPSIDTTKYENMWRYHFNSLYRVAGLLFCYVARVDKLLS